MVSSVNTEALLFKASRHPIYQNIITICNKYNLNIGYCILKDSAKSVFRWKIFKLVIYFTISPNIASLSLAHSWYSQFFCYNTAIGNILAIFCVASVLLQQYYFIYISLLYDNASRKFNNEFSVVQRAYSIRIMHFPKKLCKMIYFSISFFILN